MNWKIEKEWDIQHTYYVMCVYIGRKIELSKEMKLRNLFNRKRKRDKPLNLQKSSEKRKSY